MIILAAVCWGVIGIFYRKLSACGFTPIQIVLIRVGVAALVMTGYLLVTDKSRLKIRWQDSLWFVGTGMGSLVFFNWCYFHAMDRSSLAAASVLLYTAPAFVLVLSVIFFREKLTFRKVTALLVVFAGILLVSGCLDSGQASLSWAGILYGLGSGFGYALYSILGTVLLKKYEPETVSVYTFIFAAAGSACLVAVQPGIAGDISQPWVWVWALGIGVICSMLPFTLYTKGLTVVSPSRASVMATLEPVVAALTGAVVFGETMDAGKLSGMILILGGILLLGKEQKGT